MSGKRFYCHGIYIFKIPAPIVPLECLIVPLLNKVVFQNGNTIFFHSFPFKIILKYYDSLIDLLFIFHVLEKDFSKDKKSPYPGQDLNLQSLGL